MGPPRFFGNHGISTRLLSTEYLVPSTCASFDNGLGGRYIAAVHRTRRTACDRGAAVAATTLKAGSLAALVIVAAWWAGIGRPIAGQDAKEARFRGRLPPYYGDVVSEAQRVQIYAVQTA